MRDLTFYPGCALQSMTWDYRESITHVVGALGLRLFELRDWTCCGATAAHSLDERMAMVLPARNLAAAEAEGRDLAVACPLCFKRLSLCREMLRQKRADDLWSLELNFRVLDLARYLSSESVLEKIRQRVRLPMTDMKIVCYYGCQVVRPPKFTGYSDYENPMHLDRLVQAVGATPLDWSLKGTCCGASAGMARKDIGLTLVARLLSWARITGADAMVVCCPLCQNNLDLMQPELREQHSWDWELPIFYYTEILGLAFELEAIIPGLQSHLVDPRPLIARLRHSRQGGATETAAISGT